jgi:hypothetical protein
MGATFRLPIMAVGRIAWLSWGVTYMHADTSDFSSKTAGQAATGWQFRQATAG